MESEILKFGPFFVRPDNAWNANQPDKSAIISPEAYYRLC